MLLRVAFIIFTIFIYETSTRIIRPLFLYKVKNVCEPNLEFRIDCNACQCSPNGLHYKCTDYLCSELEQEQHPRIRHMKFKRDLGDYNDPNQDFLSNDYDPVPEEESQRLELFEQQHLMEQQLAEDQKREQTELQGQQRQLQQQLNEVRGQLQYQQALDDLQREYDKAQEDLDAQQDQEYDQLQQNPVEYKRKGIFLKIIQ